MKSKAKDKAKETKKNMQEKINNDLSLDPEN